MKCLRKFDAKPKISMFILLFIVLWINTLSLIAHATPEEDFLESINKGDIEVVREALRDGTDPNAKYKTGVTALMIAVRKGDLTLTELLLYHHADINAIAQGGFTALIYAAHEGHTDIVKLLLAHDVDTTVQTARGKTALTIAEEKGHTEIVNLLQTEINKSTEENQGTAIIAQNGPITCQDAQDCLENGNTYYDKGEYDRAIADYTQALSLNPKLAEAYYIIGGMPIMPKGNLTVRLRITRRRLA